MEKVKLGLIGCGSMGSSLANACGTLDNAEVVAVCDVDSGRVNDLAGRIGAKGYSSHAEMLSMADIDAVIIASPGRMHALHAVDSAAAGKHIFCEKPMALSVEDCDRMIEAARNHNVKLMVGQVLRYLPVFDRIKRIIDSGELGRPFSISIARIGDGRGAWAIPWRRRKSESGGILFEVSVHEIDFMRYIAGDIDRVAAFAGRYVHRDIDYEDTIQVLLHFVSGGIGSLLAGQSSAIGAYDGKILCTKGSIFFGRGDASIVYKLFDGEEVMLKGEDLEVENPVRRELRYFVESIINDTEPPIPGEEGKKAVEVAQAAYLSVERMGEVKLPL